MGIAKQVESPKAIREKRKNKENSDWEVGTACYMELKWGLKMIGVHFRKSAGCVGDAPVYWFWKVRSFVWNGALHVERPH